MASSDISILIIYTGGTIGMISDLETGALKPFDFRKIEYEVPALKKFGYSLFSHTFEPPIDSSDITPGIWVKLANLIFDNYDHYDGFVVLHGTDTMAYSASALSFMLKNLGKPVIFTGSQLPIETLRTDGRENLITAIEIAAAQKADRPLIPEVCIYFENKLYRANRTTKLHAEYFNAFNSYNYPALAKIGIQIHYNFNAIKAHNEKPFRIQTSLSCNVAILKIFPGMQPQYVESVLRTPGLEGLVLETFGSGNAMTQKWLIRLLTEATQRGLFVLNVTQCSAGRVDMSKYATGEALSQTGILSGYDLTTEAAITKMMWVLAQDKSHEAKRSLFSKDINGEMTVDMGKELLPHAKA